MAEEKLDKMNELIHEVNMTATHDIFNNEYKISCMRNEITDSLLRVVKPFKFCIMRCNVSCISIFNHVNRVNCELECCGDNGYYLIDGLEAGSSIYSMVYSAFSNPYHRDKLTDRIRLNFVKILYRDEDVINSVQ